ncbi:transcriptional regulator, LysR family [Shewanella amazonensis SB2B]|uniref:Transcriptional regulator, LysR family n=1 Tax=Shewanella amazonensis (strain ATCC BAA-1098 / SB2B) TaxID=326297 RepID=A1S1W4_SHEAM|nr:LysR family transcriptional regulator [Shewanella amazonensis]ABL98370.1 transcriptional regulator, LysR family [Shewanella amazonensis SB2B]
MRQGLNWEDIRLFVAVAELGSFSAAARQLGLGQPTLSRRIAELEGQLGEPLFIRRSQGCDLAPAGLRLLPAAAQMAQWAHDAEVSLARPEERIAGKVRITAPPGLALTLLTQVAQGLRARFPALTLEALSSTHLLDLSRGEADIALRTQEVAEPGLITVGKILSKPQFYGSREYAASLPPGATLSDLALICWSEDQGHFRVNRELHRLLPGFKPAFASDDFNVQLGACVQGLGAMVLYGALMSHPMLSSLVRLPVSFDSEYRGEIFIQVHKRLYGLPRIMAVLDELDSFGRGIAEYQGPGEA